MFLEHSDINKEDPVMTVKMQSVQMIPTIEHGLHGVIFFCSGLLAWGVLSVFLKELFRPPLFRFTE